jgi:membrane-bound lytic murein transglycosylase B
MQIESGGDARAVSPQGAMGLMQIMPQTWFTLRRRYDLGTDPYDPRDNITAGAAFLRELHDRYGDHGFLAAYNAGPSRYEEYLASGHALPPETRSYIEAVAALIDRGSSESTSVSVVMGTKGQSGTLFAGHTEVANTQMNQRPTNRAAHDWTALVPLSDGLFVKTSSHIGRP